MPNSSDCGFGHSLGLKPCNPHVSFRLANHRKIAMQNELWYGEDSNLVQTTRDASGNAVDLNEVIDTNNDGIIDEKEFNAAFGRTKEFKYLNKKRENLAGAVWDKKYQRWKPLPKDMPPRAVNLTDSFADPTGTVLKQHPVSVLMGMRNDLHTTRRGLDKWLTMEREQLKRKGKRILTTR